MRRLSLGLFVAFAALFGAAVDPANAFVQWSTVASACTPDSGAIQNDLYSDKPDSTVIPGSSALGPIVLICPVQPRSFLAPDTLSMTYRDGTATGTSAHVKAEFVRVSRSTGARTVISAVSSDSSAATKIATQQSATFSHNFAPQNFFYHVRIEIARSTTKETVQSIGVALEGPSKIVSIDVTPANSTLNIGHTKQYTATGNYSDGSTSNVTGTATWSSQTGSVASIDSSGVATGNAAGMTAIKAQIGSTSGSTNLTVVPDVCGDGVVGATEQCDDGNTANGDGCSSSCTTEAGYQCTGAPSTCSTTCGDGVKAGAEACDDGNTANGDGCSATCAIESGYQCSGSPSSCSTTCGDGVKAGAEACDDGNTTNGDGCSSTCTIETGFQCTGSPSSCTTTCGDGVKAGAEACDDGNLVNGDGCSTTCTIEFGFQCTGNAPSSCIATCGDGVKAATEQCDDGNMANGDGCSATCRIEPGYTCVGNSPSVCSAGCGDGIVSGAEQCDDGNNSNGDGCSAFCTVEAGYQCSGSPSVCVPN